MVMLRKLIGRAATSNGRLAVWENQPIPLGNLSWSWGGPSVAAIAAATASAVSDAEDDEHDRRWWTTQLQQLFLCSSTTACDKGHVVPVQDPNQKEISTSTKIKLQSAQTPQEAYISRRMTNVGRFSLISETPSNPSVPVLVLAMTEKRGQRRKNMPLNDSTNTTGDKNTSNSRSRLSSSALFRSQDFINLYKERGIGMKHPRFTAHLDPTGTYFVMPDPSKLVTPNVDSENDPALEPPTSIVRDVIYPLGGRSELIQWVNDALLTPLPLHQTLWDVQIASGGQLGQSGAITSKRMDAIIKDEGPAKGSHGNDDIIESLLLFRAHHCLADGVSLGVVFGDFMDEGPHLNEMVAQKVEEFRQKRRRDKLKQREEDKRGGIWAKLKRFLKRLSIFMYYWVWGTIKAFGYQGRLLFESLVSDSNTNPWSVLRRTYRVDDDDGVDGSYKRLAWDHVASVEEVKKVATFYSRQLETDGEGVIDDKSSGSWKQKKTKKKSRITINDIFCSCVSAAIVKLLRYHQAVNPALPPMSLDTMNLVIPVHMQGGLLLPGQSLGNKIGALITQIPGQKVVVSGHDDTNFSTRSSPTSFSSPSPGDLAQQRLLAVHQSLQDRKETPAAFWSYVIANILGAIGSAGHSMATSTSNHKSPGASKPSQSPSPSTSTSWTSFLFENASANASVVVTNVRGPEKIVHLDGRPVQAFLGFLPLAPGIPVGMVVGSYNGQVQLAVTAEAWACPDADRFLAWVVEEYDCLKAHAGVA